MPQDIEPAAPLTAEEKATRDLKTVAFWLCVAFLLGWLGLLLRFGFLHDRTGNTASETSIAFIWTLAWLSGGFLFGFLFGIPKVIAATTSSTNPALNDPAQTASPRLKVNTNLEDISDWLTKVLVGATLTQIVKIPAAIARAAAFMALGASGLQVSFNAAVIVYYSALGFLSGYLLTRLFFARAFALADTDPGLSDETAKALSASNPEFGRTPAHTSMNPSLRRAAVASEAVQLTPNLSGPDALALAKGASLTGDNPRALHAAEIAMQKLPDDPSARLTYALSLHRLGSSADTVLPLVQEAAERVTAADPALCTSVYVSLSYLWLYQPPPQGFTHTLKVLDDYAGKGGLPSAGIEINRACAYGQSYRYLSKQPANTNADSNVHSNADTGNQPQSETQADTQPGDTAVPPQPQTASIDPLQTARNNALAAVKKALTLDPTSAPRLKELLWATGASGDDDLAVFQSDPEFTSLLPRP